MPSLPAGISSLVERYVAGDCSAEELEQFFAAVSSDEHRKEIAARLIAVWETGDHPNMSWIDKDLIFERVQSQIPSSPITPVRPIFNYRTMWWAAALVITIGTAAIYFSQKSEQPRNSTISNTTDIQPGSDKVKLNLGNGKEILLDNSGSVTSGESTIVTNNSLLYYSGETVPTIHTMSTPKGRTFSVRLSDGSIVWLNATSSVTYPTRFTSGKRTIKITGEAYLEVAAGKTPFIVDVDGRSQVKVLGTEININAYSDEPEIKTTLITGAVRIENNGNSLILKPGQQAHSGKNGTFTILDEANTEKVVAWKNGIFDFTNTGTREILRELSRWYDIEVEFKGPVPERAFYGQIGRDLNLSQVLNGLKGMDLHFSLNGNKLTVTK